ncbi:hypothetical protein FE782_26855 [Paenibacillus antri]|uniref:Uncharacterized protein n=1 Tax=Paenibacillus antri TaxID=2582848 RepID=A0A5R9G4K6_9BACL|nr:hypothetical protein [Paenibacillus antri]TLS49070.1 hypothetical protein FE782_26855 [Paenibacillus antri]
MEVVIYRNVSGEITIQGFERYLSALDETYRVDRTFGPNALSYTIWGRNDRYALTLQRIGAKHRLQLHNWRLAPADPAIVEMMDACIVASGLSGEKHTFRKGVIVATIYKDGKAFASTATDDLRFELSLRKETLLGCIDLALTRYTEAKARNDERAMSDYEERSKRWMTELAKIQKRMNLQR